MTTTRPPEPANVSPVPPVGASRPIDPALRRGAACLLAGALLWPVSAVLHPSGDPDLGWEESVAGMLEASTWYAAHVVELVAAVLIAFGLAQLVRTPDVRRSRLLQGALVVAVAAMAISIVDMVPHTLAALEVDELRAGGATPLLDTHVFLQAIVTPLFAPAIAVVAVLDARRSPRWTWIPAALCVVSAPFAAIAGPLLLLTEDPAAGVLLSAYAGIAIWLLVFAIRRSATGFRDAAVA